MTYSCHHFWKYAHLGTAIVKDEAQEDLHFMKYLWWASLMNLESSLRITATASEPGIDALFSQKQGQIPH